MDYLEGKTQEDKDFIRKHMSISCECRFRNSEKKFVCVKKVNGKIKISISDVSKKFQINRSDFIAILDDKFGWLDREKKQYRHIPNTQKECIGCKYSPEFNDGVYTLECGDCTRFYGSKYHNGYLLLDEYAKQDG